MKTLRSLRKDPLFTLIAVGTLALGIGGATTMFSVVETALLKPLPYPDPEQLVMVYSTQPFVNPSPLSGLDFIDYKAQAKSFSHMAAMHFRMGLNLSLGDTAVRVRDQEVSADFFTMLNTKPVLGRVFTVEDETFNGERVVILSKPLWKERFGSDPDIVGASIQLDGKPHQVIGVVDVDLHPRGPSAELWLPHRYHTDDPQERGSHWLIGLGRMKAGVTVAQADAELKAIAQGLAAQYPTDKNNSARAIPLREQLFGQSTRALLLLWGATGVLLLIACVNVANLLLSRNQKRRGELALRMALGATPGRIVRQLLGEALVLGALGAIAGSVVAVWSIDALRAFDFLELRQVGGASVDGGVLLFVAGLAVIASVCFGLMPALDASRVDLQTALRDVGGKASQTRAHRRLGQTLVVAELVLALVLLCGAGFAGLSLWRIARIDLGFEPRGMLQVRVTPPYEDDAKSRQFFETLRQRVALLPGVESAALMSSLPLGNTNINGGMIIVGRKDWPDNHPISEWRAIDPHYFEVAKIPLKAGRNFTADDKRVIIINEAMAKRFWPDSSPLGSRVGAWWSDESGFEIIGVAGSTEGGSIAELNGREKPSEIYFPYAGGKGEDLSMGLVLRAQVPPETLVAAIQAEVTRLDSSLPIFDVVSGEEMVANRTTQERVIGQLSALFAVLATLLAGVGVYGVIAYQMGRRRSEIAIRLALGAAPERIQGLLLRETAHLVLIGGAIGTIIALGVERVMGNLIYGGSLADIWVSAVVTAFLAAVALLATYVPARKATRMDPNAALRYE